METILFYETKNEEVTYTVKTEENKKLNIYRTTIEQKDHKGKVIVLVNATYQGHKKKALQIAQNEIKNTLEYEKENSN